MSVEADVVELFARVDRDLGTVTTLVNNAGMVASKSRVDEMGAERVSQIFSVNVVGTFTSAREAIRRTSTRHGGQGGTIVNVSSVASRIGSPGEYVDYVASKAAVDAMTVGLSKEVATEGIRVNAVRPGVVARKSTRVAAKRTVSNASKGPFRWAEQASRMKSRRSHPWADQALLQGPRRSYAPIGTATRRRR